MGRIHRLDDLYHDLKKVEDKLNSDDTWAPMSYVKIKKLQTLRESLIKEIKEIENEYQI